MIFYWKVRLLKESLILCNESTPSLEFVCFTLRDTFQVLADENGEVIEDNLLIEKLIHRIDHINEEVSLFRGMGYHHCDVQY